MLKSLLTTVALVTLLSSCTNTQELQRQQNIDDSITTTISDKIRVDRNLNPYNIRVETSGSNVYIRGDVDTHAEAAKIESIALATKNVISVENGLNVRKIVSEPKRGRDSVRQDVTDTALTASIKLLILNDPSIDAANITVTTRNGIVFLGGTAPTHADIIKAKNIASRVKGVKRVDNKIEAQ